MIGRKRRAALVSSFDWRWRWRLRLRLEEEEAPGLSPSPKPQEGGGRGPSAEAEGRGGGGPEVLDLGGRPPPPGRPARWPPSTMAHGPRPRPTSDQQPGCWRCWDGVFDIWPSNAAFGAHHGPPRSGEWRRSGSGFLARRAFWRAGLGACRGRRGGPGLLPNRPGFTGVRNKSRAVVLRLRASVICA
jgi:hypothetical protein